MRFLSLINIQASLPKLPVPFIKNTSTKYLKCLEPLLNAKEFFRVKHCCNEFVNNGLFLQDLLQNRSKEHDNWLSEWWLNKAYLENKIPLIINNNPGILFPKLGMELKDFSKFVSLIIYGIEKFKNILLDGNLDKVENVKSTPICISQYYNIFGNCRIPGLDRKSPDNILFSVLSKNYKYQINKSNYIMVFRKNKVWKVSLPDNDLKYYTMVLPKLIDQLLINSDKIIDEMPINIMTATFRDDWRDIYNKLNEINPTNKTVFDAIQKSSFVVCLDPPLTTSQCHSSTIDDTLVANNILHGLGTVYNTGNRWFDKTLQIIISEDRTVGINYEHTVAEGGPYITLMNYLVEHAQRDELIFSNNDISSNPQSFSHFCQSLQFTKTTEIDRAIDVAKEQINNLIGSFNLRLYRFDRFGKSEIKKYGVSPDAFIQVALQLAYYRIHGTVCSTYESASTRKFLYGRTETIRSCTNESKAFCEVFTAFADHDAIWNTQINKENLKDLTHLFFEAIKRHQQLTKEAMNGEGIDRHLLGLRILAQELVTSQRNFAMPTIFTDPSYAKSLYFSLSTSQISTRHNSWMFYGPAERDDFKSYAFCYNPQKNGLNYAISLLNSQDDAEGRDDTNKKLSETFENSMDAMLFLLKSIA